MDIYERGEMARGAIRDFHGESMRVDHELKNSFAPRARSEQTALDEQQRRAYKTMTQGIREAQVPADYLERIQEEERARQALIHRNLNTWDPSPAERLETFDQLWNQRTRGPSVYQRHQTEREQLQREATLERLRRTARADRPLERYSRWQLAPSTTQWADTSIPSVYDEPGSDGFAPY